MPARLPGPHVMTTIPTKSKPTELEQAAADRRSFGNSDLAANAEFKVIAEGMRELVSELRLIRRALDKLVVASSPGESHAASVAGTSAATRPGGTG